ncbi:hypothetical protein Hanom_Chr10g00956161 [Helianthus anomalus]
MQPVVYRVCIYWDYACAHFSCCRLTHSGTTAVNLWLYFMCFYNLFLCILCVVVEMFEAARKGVTPGQRLIDIHPSSTIHYHHRHHCVHRKKLQLLMTQHLSSHHPPSTTYPFYINFNLL